MDKIDEDIKRIYGTFLNMVAESIFDMLEAPVEGSCLFPAIRMDRLATVEDQSNRHVLYR